jgi:hypothetical protein
MTEQHPDSAASTPRSNTGGGGWLALGTLPVIATVLVARNALYLLLVAFGNITDFDTNQRSGLPQLRLGAADGDRHPSAEPTLGRCLTRGSAGRRKDERPRVRAAAGREGVGGADGNRTRIISLED